MHLWEASLLACQVIGQIVANVVLDVAVLVQGLKVSVRSHLLHPELARPVAQGNAQCMPQICVGARRVFVPFSGIPSHYILGVRMKDSIALCVLGHP